MSARKDSALSEVEVASRDKQGVLVKQYFELLHGGHNVDIDDLIHAMNEFTTSVAQEGGPGIDGAKWLWMKCLELCPSDSAVILYYNYARSSMQA